ncbi:MAG: hypothetical protein JWR04_1489 [Rhodoglobus sp.]|nr:hypothetical protein [Rhodoglobus sp.]
MTSESTWTQRSDPSSQSVAIEVLRRGPISRIEIARRLNLSAPSLSRLTAPLIEQGLLIETGTQNEGRVGRPTQLLDVQAGARNFIGIKLRENELVAALTDLRGDIISYETRALTDRTPSVVVALLADAVAELSRGLVVSAIGIGIGGLVRDRSYVVSARFLEWDELPLAELVTRATGIPTVVDNDLIAFTEYERWFGAGSDDDRFAVVSLGAGTGFGLVANRELVVNEDYGLGLIGHWPLDPLGPMCPAGHRGCAHALLSSDCIARNVGAAIGRDVDYDEALDLAEAGQPAAREILSASGRGLGRLLAAVCNMTMPQRIIIGGEGVRLAIVAEDAVQQGLALDRDSRAHNPPIVYANGDNREWCRGAAALAIQAMVLGTLPSTA